MKNKRHEKILELIALNDIETQEELAGMLNAAGFDVTQATVSRDIKKLSLIKIKANGNRQKYAVNTGVPVAKNDKIVRVLQDTITGMEDAQNILVIKTVPGMAMGAAAALDSLQIPEIIGSIAGDDTIMCVTKDTKHTKEVMDKIRAII